MTLVRASVTVLQIIAYKFGMLNGLRCPILHLWLFSVRFGRKIALTCESKRAHICCFHGEMHHILYKINLHTVSLRPE